MKYTKVLILCSIILSAHSLTAQELCVTQSPTYMSNSSSIILAKTQGHINLSTASIVEVGIAVHIVRDNSGNGVSENLLPTMLSNLNNAFAAAKIHFFIVSKDYIVGSRFAESGPSTDPVEQDELCRVNTVGNAINLYFVKNPAFHGSATFTPLFAHQVARYDEGIIILNDVIATAVLPHEFGHYFDLFHTHETTVWTLDDQSTIGGIENPNGSNGSTTGDLIGQTLAEPSKRPVTMNLANFGADGTYLGLPEVSIGGTTYPYDSAGLSSINGHNFMSYNMDVYSNYRNTFTSEQAQRLRDTYEYSRFELKKNWVQFTNKIGVNNAGGSFTVDGATIVQSGNYTPLSDLTTHSIKTNNERFTSNKHNNWDGTTSNYLLSTNFNAAPLPSSHDANFTSLSTATIKAQLVEGGTSEVEIRDPWYVSDANNAQPNTFFTVLGTYSYTPTGKYNQTTGGVFLNQGGPDINNLTPPYYSINAPAKTINGVTYLFQNWSVTAGSATFQNANAATTPVVFTLSGTNIVANYKGSLASNTSTAMSEPSQRKIAQGNTGDYFLTYESAGKIWVEYLTNGGTTWRLANNSQPFGYGTTPSITPYYNGALVTFDYSACAGLYYVTSSGTQNYDELTGLNNEFDGSLVTPVVSYNDYAGEYIVLWRSPFGIHYSIGYRASNGHGSSYMNWFVNSATLSGSNSSSYTPTVDCKSNVFQIAWQQISGSSSSIYYTSLVRQPNGTYTQSAVQGFSAGLPINSKPSVIARSDGARLCWIANDPSVGEAYAIFHAPGYYAYWYFGWNVTSASLNQSADGNYLIGWANGDGSQQYTNNRHLSSPQPLSSAGNDVQIANSDVLSTMRSVGFTTGSTPYRFNISPPIPFYKSSGIAVGKGRGGLVTLNGGEFMFMLGDVAAGNEKIDFIDMPDTVKIYDATSLNTYLETAPFTIAEKTPFSYGVEYWTADSGKAVTALAGGKTVSFKVEMVDAKTNALIASFDHCQYTSTNVQHYKNIGYDVNTDGIVSRQVKLRLRVSAGDSAVFAVANRAATGFALKKTDGERVKLNLNEAFIVTSYGMEQNYPNPFNPTTTINYQIPKDGNVTLKVYDVLGKEVATLANEVKTMGRYSVLFNGANLSSGAYIVRMSSRPNDGKDVVTKLMKVLLVK